MGNVSFLIKPASSLCNMRCQYCFYTDVCENREIKSFGIMEKETMEAIIQRGFQYIGEKGNIFFSFQGGEPTIAGLKYFQDFVETVNRYKTNFHKIHYALQTNGFSIDKDWAKFFSEHHFLIGVSLDGYKENHDFYRKDRRNNGTFQRVVSNMKILEQYHVSYNILTVLTSKLAKHPIKLYKFYQKYNFLYIQLIPCLDGLESHNLSSLTPKLFSNFYQSFYREWLQEVQSGKIRSINLFDNWIQILKEQKPYQCGMLGFCSPQLVIEGDGGIYPCDFYVLDPYYCGNIKDTQLKDVLQSPAMKKFLTEEKEDYLVCKDCSFEKICHGGCKRQRICFAENEYCGYQEFLKDNIHSLYSLAQSQRI